MIFKNFPKLLLAHLQTTVNSVDFIADYFPVKPLVNGLVLVQDAVLDQSCYGVQQAQHEVTLHLYKSHAINDASNLYQAMSDLVTNCEAWQPQADFQLLRVNLLAFYLASSSKALTVGKVKLAFTLHKLVAGEEVTDEPD